MTGMRPSGVRRAVAAVAGSMRARILEPEDEHAAHVGALVLEPADATERLRQGQARAFEHDLGIGARSRPAR